MGPQATLRTGTRVLHIATSALEHLSLIELAISESVRTHRRFYALLSPILAPIARQALELAVERPRASRVSTLQDECPDASDPDAALRGVVAFAADCERMQWKAEDSDIQSIFLLDLNPLLAMCSSGAEAMDVLDRLGGMEAADRRALVEAVTAVALPRGLSERFLDLHDEWIVGRGPTASPDAGLTQSVRTAAFATPGYRSHFADRVLRDPTAVAALLPRPFRDYRRGLVVLDADLVIRHVTEGAAPLVGRDAGELIGEHIETCLDGVDLLAVKRESTLHQPGSPFVVSWRLSAGEYASREISIDPILSENRRVGSLLSVGHLEPRRGPRVVYREMAADDAASDPEDPDRDDSLAESLRESHVTRREHEILLLILDNASNREIARELDIAEVTVKKHLTSLYRKLRIGSRFELARSFARPERP